MDNIDICKNECERILNDIRAMCIILDTVC